MRKRIVLLSLILILILYSVNELYSVEYGKIIGVLIDKKTGEPVDEEFVIKISSKKERYFTETKDGKFVVDKIIPDNYWIIAEVMKEQTKYEITTSIRTDSEGKPEPIYIEASKITRVKIYVERGARLKIQIVSSSGEKLNLGEIFDTKLDFSIYLNKRGMGMWTYKDDNINDGEIYLYAIIKGTYDLTLDVSGIGYPIFERKNVKLESSETTIIRFTMDLNYPTGIEGYVKDQNGKNVKGAIVVLLKRNNYNNFESEAIVSRCKTNEDGFYKISIKKEGVFFIYAGCGENNCFESKTKKEMIIIKKNKVKIKDFIIRMKNWLGGYNVFYKK